MSDSARLQWLLSNLLWADQCDGTLNWVLNVAMEPPPVHGSPQPFLLAAIDAAMMPLPPPPAD